MFINRHIFFVFTSKSYYYLQTLHIPTVDNTTANFSYKKKLKTAFDKLDMVLQKKYHFGRYIAAAVLDMEEVDPMISRAIGNRAIDTFGEVYSTKLPFSAMRVLARGDTRRGNYRNLRTPFKGNAEHKELAKKFFP